LYRSSPFDIGNPIADFDAIRISLASPEKIPELVAWRSDQPETINYRTFKPERDGLFCARIFGPVTDWSVVRQVQAVKHRRSDLRQVRREVTLSKVRRERLATSSGFSLLACLVLKGLPSRIGHLLDIRCANLESVLYSRLMWWLSLGMRR